MNPKDVERAVSEALVRIELLTIEAKARQEGGPLQIERVKQSLVNAANCDVFGFERKYLARNYDMRRNENSKTGWAIRKNNKVVTPEQLALDIATGLLAEIAERLDTDLHPVRALAAPEAIEAQIIESENE